MKSFTVRQTGAALAAAFAAGLMFANVTARAGSIEEERAAAEFREPEFKTRLEEPVKDKTPDAPRRQAATFTADGGGAGQGTENRTATLLAPAQETTPAFPEPEKGFADGWETRIVSAIPNWITEAHKGNDFKKKIFSSYSSKGYEVEVTGCEFKTFSEGTVSLLVRKVPPEEQTGRFFEFWSGNRKAIETRIEKLSEHFRANVKCHRITFFGDANALIQYEARSGAGGE